MSMFNISENAANLIYTISHIILVVGAVLALMGTIGAYWSGGIRERFFDTKIAKNVADTAKANAESARANERAATLEKDAADARLETERIKERLAVTAKLAEPTKLTFLSAVRNTEGTELCETVFFRASKNESMGQLDFNIIILGDTNVTISKLWPSLKAGAFQTGDHSFQRAKNGKSGTLSYIPLGAGIAAFDITLSGPAVVRITGNRLHEPCDVKIE